MFPRTFALIRFIVRKACAVLRELVRERDYSLLIVFP